MDNGSAVSLIIARYDLLMLTYNECQSGYGLFGIRSFLFFGKKYTGRSRLAQGKFKATWW